MADIVRRKMNEHEKRAWRTLRDFGARTTEIGGKRALDLRSIDVGLKLDRSKRLAMIFDAVIQVVGHSGSNTRHQDGYGRLVFITTEDPGMDHD